MSFSTDIADSTKTKIVLAELDIPLIFTSWINYQAGVWFTKLLDANQTITDDYGVTGYYEANVSEVPNKIGSCLVDTEFYTKVNSIAECVALEKSFYHNESTNEVYIRFEDWKPYINQIIRLGAVNGFTNIVNSNGAYYDDIYYDSRVIEVPNLSQKKDPLFYGIQSFQSGNISFANEDGFFNNYNDLNIYSQPCRILVGVDGYDYSDFEQLFEGFIDDYNYDSKKFTIKVQDKRKNLSRKVPYSQFNQTEYPYLHDDDVGKYKPVLFGSVKYYPVVCINKTESSPDYRTFKFLDTEFDIASIFNTIYLNTLYFASIKNEDDDSIFDQVTITSMDRVAGTFDIVSSLVEVGGEVKDVFYTGVGYSNADDSFQMFQFIIDKMSDISYNSTFFNTTEISTEWPSPYNIGYYVKKPETLIDLIKKICEAENMIFYVQNDGRYSFKKYDNDRASTQTIPNDSWEEEFQVNYNTGTYLTSAMARGRLHVAKDEYLLYYNNTRYEKEGLYKYKKYNSKEYDTILLNTGSEITGRDLYQKTEEIMIQSKDIVRIVKRTCDMSAYSISLMDFITASHTRQSEEEDFKVWEVISHNLDLTNWKINLEMKYQREV